MTPTYEAHYSQQNYTSHASKDTFVGSESRVSLVNHQNDISKAFTPLCPLTQ